jgi:hypothetical protein
MGLRSVLRGFDIVKHLLFSKVSICLAHCALPLQTRNRVSLQSQLLHLERDLSSKQRLRRHTLTNSKLGDPILSEGTRHAKAHCASYNTTVQCSFSVQRHRKITCVELR